MRILVLTKRQYTGKDLLNDRYGRLYEIPEALADLGHDVQGLTLSYRLRDEGKIQLKPETKTQWTSINIGPNPLGIFKYLLNLRKIIKSFHPDLVWASSDAYHVIIARQFCSIYRTPLIADLYDNYESFTASKIPGIRKLLRSVCRKADGLTVVSRSLDNLVESQYKVACPRLVLGNAINELLFTKRNKITARELLGLPPKARLIGTAGAITDSRGITDLFEAFLKLAEVDREIWLVFAGPRDHIPAKYHHERIIDLGIISSQQVSELFSSLDVAIICNRDSSFGEYCFPQKFYEILACNIPLVVAAVGDMAILLQTTPACLYPPGHPNILAEKILAQLHAPIRVSNIPVPTWGDRAAELNQFVSSVLGKQSR